MDHRYWEEPNFQWVLEVFSPGRLIKWLINSIKSIILCLAVILCRTHPLKVITVLCANNTAVSFLALSCAVRLLSNRQTIPQNFSVWRNYPFHKLRRCLNPHSINLSSISSLFQPFLVSNKGNFWRSCHKNREGSFCSMELYAFTVDHQHPQPVVLPLYPRNGPVILRGHSTVSFWQNICLHKCISYQFVQAHTLFLCIYFTKRGAMTAQNRWTEENRFEWMWQLGRRWVLSNSQGW